jgi:site-specific DNA recombinase
MERAIAYIRVSDPRQADDGSSLNTQEKQVRAQASQQGYELVHVFKEEGESAKTDQRPELQRLVAFCKERRGKIDVLIVPKIDRLARNAYDYANLKLTFGRYGVRLESVGERIEDTPVGRFTESIMASVAQFDNEVRAERSKGGMIEAVSQGRWVWKAPKGYRNVRHEGKGTIEPKPGEAELVAQAFKMLASRRQNPARVHTWLAEMGLPISRPAFYSLIGNSIYIGKIEAFGHTFDACPPFVPLVTPATFYGAKKALRAVRAPLSYQCDREEFPLRGTLRCSCGAFLTACFSRGKTKTYGYYRCMRCRGANYRSDQVHDQWLRELLCYRPAPGVWPKIEARLRETVEASRSAEASRRKELEAKVDRLRAVQKGIALKNAEGIVPDDVAKAQLEDLGRQIQDVLARGVTEPLEMDVEHLLRFAQRLLDNLGDHWAAWPLQRKKDLLRFMFPSGVTYIAGRGIRTLDNPLLEQIKGEVGGNKSSLVDHDVRFYNSLHRWIRELYGRFADLPRNCDDVALTLYPERKERVLRRRVAPHTLSTSSKIPMNKQELFTPEASQERMRGYYEELSAKGKAAMAVKTSAGETMSRAPLGWLNARDERGRSIIVPDPQRYHLVEEAHTLHAGGMTVRSVLKHMTELGLRGRNGKPLSVKGMWHVLRCRPDSKRRRSE